MLTAFYQSYLLIVAICALFCLLVNLYNLVFFIMQGPRNRRMEKRVLRLVREMVAAAYSKEKSDRLFRRMSMRGFHLRALYEAMDRLNWHSAPQIPDSVYASLCHAFQANIHAYTRRDPPQRALAVLLGARLGVRTESFRALLGDCLYRSPMYLRIIALRALSQQGHQTLMLETLKTVSSHGSIYSVKLISDVLLLYSGDKASLFEQLFPHLPSHSENVRRAVIGVMTQERMSMFAPGLLDMVRQPDMELECRIAAIKYFGTVVYPPAEPVLSDLLALEDWECAAVAARALKSYDCASAGEALLKALASTNWHVRYNAAMTLTARRTDLIERARSHEDRYARDIMAYALSIAQGGEN